MIILVGWSRKREIGKGERNHLLLVKMVPRLLVGAVLLEFGKRVMED